jgi:general secretion pathway protein J
MRRNGFTLIELLVALLLFSLIAAAGVMLLSGSVSGQGAVRRHLDELAGFQRTASLMTSDFAQSVPRVTRTQQGTRAPSFFAANVPGRALVQFVRAGWDNLDDSPRPSLEKLEYWLVDGRLERRDYPELDGAVPSVPAVLAEGVTEARFRFRDERGDWRSDWTAKRADALPRAVELTLVRKGQSPVTLAFLVGPGGAPPRGAVIGG